VLEVLSAAATRGKGPFGEFSGYMSPAAATSDELLHHRGGARRLSFLLKPDAASDPVASGASAVASLLHNLATSSGYPCATFTLRKVVGASSILVVSMTKNIRQVKEVAWGAGR